VFDGSVRWLGAFGLLDKPEFVFPRSAFGIVGTVVFVIVLFDDVPVEVLAPLIGELVFPAFPLRDLM